MSLDEIFTDPPAAYRGKPFWAWNGLLEQEELRRQIRVFKRMGLGGAFMHSRVGLATEYLSGKWFDLIAACTDEAKKNEMEAWLYDEDRWPSGAAGGIVTRDAAYRQKVLRLTIADPAEYRMDGSELAVFLAVLDGNVAKDVRLIAGNASPGKEDRLLVFQRSTAELSPWYNGQTYLDTLSPEAVGRFIEVTHEAYARNVGDELGGVIPGIFTDEPNYGGYDVEQDGAHSPWTDALPEVFRDRHGYDLLPHLPEIFFRVEGQEFSKVRYHYREVLTHLFTSSFAEQIGKWCQEHNLLFTGHVLAEENLLSQTSVVGSPMGFYEFMQAPGIDILRGEVLTRRGGFPPEIATAKQCSSVQHQFGRKWMLSELYGCTGWQFTFAEHKAVGDWQAALGVNLRCQHLAYYTMLGQAKRDYPASISFQSPWWRDYAVVEDYFARVGVVMTQGEPVRDIAVIHPIESAWGLFCGRFEDSKALWDLNESFEELQRLLLEEHYDFDYIDEGILSRHGRVEGDALRVVEARYRAVIVPPTWTLRSSTLALLEDMFEAGVPVVFIEEVATRVDAEEDGRIRDLAARSGSIGLNRKEVQGFVSNVPGIRRVSVLDSDDEEFPDSLYMMRRDEEGGTYVFLCHTKQDRPTGVLRVRIPGRGQVQEWDPTDGSIYLCDAVQQDGYVEIRTQMPGYGSRVFVVDPTPRSDLPRRPDLEERRSEIVDPGKWRVHRDEPNALPLDKAQYSIEGGPWRGPEEVLRIDMAIRDEMGIPHRGGRMVQPWVRGEGAKPGRTEVSLRFCFRVESIPQGPCHLVVEEPWRYEIKLNGQPIILDQDEGWWIDPAFKRIRIPPGLLMIGDNELTLQTEYGSGAGLESLYFTGEFGVRWDPGVAVIEELPRELSLGDWTEQGFPCYSGAITYSTQVPINRKEDEKVYLQLPGWQGVLAKLRLNGSPVGAIAWPPFEVDLTPGITEGLNRLEIEIVSSRRNLLGPLHLTEAYPIWTGAGQFTTSGDEWTEEYVKIPYGLMEAPVLSFRTER